MNWPLLFARQELKATLAADTLINNRAEPNTLIDGGKRFQFQTAVALRRKFYR